MIIKKIIITLFLISLIELLPVKAENLIIPGGRIGGFYIKNTTVEEVKELFGKPDRTELEGYLMYFYNTYGIIFQFAGSGKILTIITTNSYYETADGIKVGSNINEAIPLYPRRKELFKEDLFGTWWLNYFDNIFAIYQSEQISFVYDNTGKIIAISCTGLK